MPFVDTSGLKVIERLPGWKGRYVHSPSMTFAHYEFAAGSTIHEHSHPEEEVYEVIEGELELTIDGNTEIAKPGIVAIVPANIRHSVRALTDGHLIVVDHPARTDFGQASPGKRKAVYARQNRERVIDPTPNRTPKLRVAGNPPGTRNFLDHRGPAVDV